MSESEPQKDEKQPKNRSEYNYGLDMIISECLLLLFAAFPMVFAYLFFTWGMIWLIIPFLIIFYFAFRWLYQKYKNKKE